MHTGSAVLYLGVIGGTNFCSLMNEWRGYISRLYFRVCVLFRENKNLSKISNYTVPIIKNSTPHERFTVNLPEGMYGFQMV